MEWLEPWCMCWLIIPRCFKSPGRAPFSKGIDPPTPLLLLPGKPNVPIINISGGGVHYLYRKRVSTPSNQVYIRSLTLLHRRPTKKTKQHPKPKPNPNESVLDNYDPEQATPQKLP